METQTCSWVPDDLLITLLLPLTPRVRLQGLCTRERESSSGHGRCLPGACQQQPAETAFAICDPPQADAICWHYSNVGFIDTDHCELFSLCRRYQQSDESYSHQTTIYKCVSWLCAPSLQPTSLELDTEHLLTWVLLTRTQSSGDAMVLKKLIIKHVILCKNLQ